MASGANFFRGTSLDQDSRFFNHHKKLLARMKFPASFGQKVHLAKINKEVIHQWITEKIHEVLGFEDDIVTSMAINLLEPANPLEPLDPKEMQVALTGFLETDAAAFMEELWNLLLSAQENPTGIPQIFLDKKKREMEQKRAAEQQQREKLQQKLKDMHVAPGTDVTVLAHGTTRAGVVALPAVALVARVVGRLARAATAVGHPAPAPAATNADADRRAPSSPRTEDQSKTTASPDAKPAAMATPDTKHEAGANPGRSQSPPKDSTPIRKKQPRSPSSERKHSRRSRSPRRHRRSRSHDRRPLTAAAVRAVLADDPAARAAGPAVLADDLTARAAAHLAHDADEFQREKRRRKVSTDKPEAPADETASK
ncbi:serine/arginine repetitive matrix protein [Achlya hypogyna]|uniref:Serine/arginine repetitive matrix protein n=1 Tax=Achlya hypogyna TaxID=1202772 RepID=A0A1V9YND8_ACHHY|nr:serine/arginine repetitive matrix protein [Achlya hypogyna]